ncbi:hypothetical protein STANM309S_01901 [Streptomyces tanashiensis]
MPSWATSVPPEPLEGDTCPPERDAYSSLCGRSGAPAPPPPPRHEGCTGVEIAERIELPPALEKAWHARGYYGSLSHNSKAIYQRYLGWYDSNPAHLWDPPALAGKSLQELGIGVEGDPALLTRLFSYVTKPDPRFPVVTP